MKVLLVSTNRLVVPFPVYPLGLDHVAGALAGAHETSLLDLAAAGGLAALEPALEAFRPDVVGLSIRNIDNTEVNCSAGFVEDVREAAATVRRVSRARLVLGGAGFGLFPAELLAVAGADCGVAGEGECFRPLLDAWARGEDGTAVPGVVWPGRPFRVPEPWAGSTVPDFDPARPHVAHYLRRGGALNLQTKRGCPYRCAYCTYPALEGHRVRPFPPREVARTARRLQEGGARYLFVTDSVFNIDPEHNLAIVQAFRDEGVRLPWCAFFAPHAPPPDYYPRLREAGLTHVEFGTEALAPETLEAYRKPFGVEAVRAAHGAARAAGLHVAHYFLLGGPGETRATLERTLAEAERLEGSARFFFCGVRVYPGTAVHERALAEGQVRPGQDLLQPAFYRCPDLPAESILEAVAARGSGRREWVVGSGGTRVVNLMKRRHARGQVGPLWEMLLEPSAP